MKRILLVYNKIEREYEYLTKIKKSIEETDGDIKVIIVPGTPTLGLIKNVSKFKPKIILTFPFTSKGSSDVYYFLKFLYKFKLISYRSEGIMNYSSKRNLQWHTGNENYGKSLIDLEVFWGKKQEKVLGQILLEKKKISSYKRIISVGSPMFEDLEKQKKHHKQRKVLLFATGFHIANYSKKDLINAKDIPSKDIRYSVNVSKKSRHLRDKLINTLINVSNKSNYEIYLKIHPIEDIKDYTFNNKKIKVFKEKSINELMPICDYFFHYGSTTQLNSYIFKKPSFYFYSETLTEFYSDLDWFNFAKIEINNLQDFILSKKFEAYTFRLNPKINNILDEQINFSFDKPYRPSFELSNLILSKQKSQKIFIYNYFFIRSIFRLFIKSLMYILKIKKS